MKKSKSIKLIKKAWSLVMGKDVINILVWVGIVYGGLYGLGYIFGPDEMPAISMRYLMSSLAGIGVFSIVLMGAWYMLKRFFPLVTDYFTDPDGEGVGLDSEFVNDIKTIRKTEKPEFQCFRRPLFFLSIYAFFVLCAAAMIAAIL